jgi:hypothetical protein
MLHNFHTRSTELIQHVGEATWDAAWVNTQEWT